MIQIKNIYKCCGCEACVQICPQHCIKLNTDHEGFSYPEADVEQCIDCGLCETVCPVLHPYEEKHPMETLAAVNKNENVRMSSSSGGIFSFLADQVIDGGGVVFGVRFDDEWMAVFDFAETKEAVATFRGSKYLQARVGDAYIRCRDFLESGRQVLFSGTPCQIAGLNHFLRKDYQNLLTVDFVCHGVPSPKVWQCYTEELMKKNDFTRYTTIKSVSFRDKKWGWRNFCLSLTFCDQSGNRKTMRKSIKRDAYLQAFVRNLILRPSCHRCPSKSGRSHSDLTIADFWEINRIRPEMDSDKGVSLILINTKKGKNSINEKQLDCRYVNSEQVLFCKILWSASSKPHIKRDIFFQKFYHSDAVIRLLYKYTKESVWKISFRFVSRVRRKIRHCLKHRSLSKN